VGCAKVIGTQNGEGGNGRCHSGGRTLNACFAANLTVGGRSARHVAGERPAVSAGNVTKQSGRGSRGDVHPADTAVNNVAVDGNGVER
jgi:hypothetical protein